MSGSSASTRYRRECEERQCMFGPEQFETEAEKDKEKREGELQ